MSNTYILRISKELKEELDMIKDKFQKKYDMDLSDAKASKIWLKQLKERRFEI